MNGDLTATVAVEVVRPSTNYPELIGAVAGNIANVFISALVVWWLHRYVPLAPDIDYVQSVCLIVVVRTIARPRGNSYRFWTKRRA